VFIVFGVEVNGCWIFTHLKYGVQILWLKLVGLPTGNLLETAEKNILHSFCHKIGETNETFRLIQDEAQFHW